MGTVLLRVHCASPVLLCPAQYCTALHKVRAPAAAPGADSYRGENGAAVCDLGVIAIHPEEEEAEALGYDKKLRPWGLGKGS